MKFSCCIELIFTEYPFIERIYQAKQAGFDFIEFWCWQEKDLPAIRDALHETGLSVGIFQGNISGRMIDQKDNAEYLAGVMKSVEAAQYLGAKNLFLMSDILKEDRSVLEAEYPISDDAKKESTIRILKELEPVACKTGISFVIEPLNTKVDHKGYSLCQSLPAFEIVHSINNSLIKVLYDVYHMQIMEGNLIETIRSHINDIGYVHIADVPGRIQPGTGEINYKNVISALDGIGYNGIVGFEFTPSGKSEKVVSDVFQLIK